MTYDFNPFFGKDLTLVSGDDLAVLREVSEGWYVEYKREVPSSKAIAKSISAFANSYGGWLFLGVDEGKEIGNCARSFPGIPKAEIDAVLQRIRQSVASHLNPTPHFDVKVVNGPVSSIELIEENCIVCLYVRQGADAPFVHSSGVIYRRVSDSSEPIGESDRHQLELMWSRREKANSSYREWISRTPEFPVSAKQAYTRILLDADPFSSRGLRWNLSVHDLKEHLNKGESTYVVPFETVHQSGYGLVARQTSSLRHLKSFGLTWIFGANLRSEILMPVNVWHVSDPLNLVNAFSNYEHVHNFCEVLQSFRSTATSVFDLTHSFITLIALATKYRSLLKSVDPNIKSVRAKVIISGVNYSIPYIDSSFVLEKFRKYGVPVCLFDDQMIPSALDSSGFLDVSLDTLSGLEDLQGAGSAVWLFEMICAAVGLEGFVQSDEREASNKFLEDLLGAHEKRIATYQEGGPPGPPPSLNPDG